MTNNGTPQGGAIFDKYRVDMLLKGVLPAHEGWKYVVRIEPWSDLMAKYPRFWKGVLKCTDAYEELGKRERQPKCQNFHICQCEDPKHYEQFSHHHSHTTNIVLESMAYNEALDALGDSSLRRCTVPPRPNH